MHNIYLTLTFFEANSDHISHPIPKHVGEILVINR